VFISIGLHNGHSSHVDLLNKNSVDIDFVPLNAFDLDGAGHDSVEGDGGEDIDVEEVLDASQATQQKKRTLNYTDLEDLCLVRAWENFSLDVVTCTYQTSKRYWKRNEDKFYHPIAIASPLITSNRMAGSLQGHWDVTKASCS
jgi:hypothetical protein